MSKTTFEARAKAQGQALKAEEEKAHKAMQSDMIALLEEIENDLDPIAEKLRLILDSFPANAPGVDFSRTLSNIIEHNFKAKLEALRQS